MTLEAELVESAEGGQVGAGEAGRRGSVGHVEVFRMGSVRTSILGRPRRLSPDRRARPDYTLIWEEPFWLAGVCCAHAAMMCVLPPLLS